MPKFTFEVKGLPVTKGSMRGFVVKGKGKGKGKPRAVVVPANSDRLKDWMADLRHAMQAFPHAPLDEAVAVDCLFRLVRPQSLAKRVSRPVKQPDVDKLVRAVFDAMTGVVVVDDARITDLVARKRFAGGEFGPGLYATVTWGEGQEEML